MQCLIGCFKSHIQQAQNSMYMYIMIVFMFLIGCLTLYSEFIKYLDDNVVDCDQFQNL